MDVRKGIRHLSECSCQIVYSKAISPVVASQYQPVVCDILYAEPASLYPIPGHFSPSVRTSY